MLQQFCSYAVDVYRHVNPALLLDHVGNMVNKHAAIFEKKSL